MKLSLLLNGNNSVVQLLGCSTDRLHTHIHTHTHTHNVTQLLWSQIWKTSKIYCRLTVQYGNNSI